ncbi:MAG: amylo-alpha-1,6-glucosidase [Bacteroidales bacterium]|jgi:predicted glycogen debranching enzyme|nr:amylo-alpha-1,6-glucosidase [Bacteroidales bacterium]
MSYIEFDQEKLVNINFSKGREILRCSRTGSYASTTLLGLNTRKYHGVLVTPQDKIDGERHVLVSNLNETIIIDNMEFHVGLHQYQGGVIAPKGNKYLQKFICDVIPTYHFRVGKFNFTKEFLMCNEEDRLILKYTILDDYESAQLLFSPLLAFRNAHQLTRQNPFVNTQNKPINNGVEYCLYDNYTPVAFQSNAPVSYLHAPVWFHNFEYEEELKRGYEGHEDLINLGTISVMVEHKEIYLSIGITPIAPEKISVLFEMELNKRTKRSSYVNCLQNAAEQFIIKRNRKTQVIAGYPWFGRWGRDTFIALPGLTLAINKPILCKEVMDNMLLEMQNGLFPNMGDDDHPAYNSVDAPLWFIRTLQKYTVFTKSHKKIWKEYGDAVKQILYAYRNGTLFNIKMLENGLLFAGDNKYALTWMDAVVNGVPITPRTGCQVEINGLWYNALKFSIEVASHAKDDDFVNDWEGIAKDFPTVYKDTFWSKEKGYLADFVNGEEKNFQIRPNMVIVASLPYSPISEKIRQLILKKAHEELLTPRGLRTLSPNDPDYKGRYIGNQKERDAAYHQGTCWPWLLEPFAEGLLAVHQKDAIPVLEEIFYNFDASMLEYGISTVEEITDGDPPYRPNGCISQAWSVAALLSIKWMIDNK